MKWHNFLIYFSLWFGGLINIGMGGLMLVGAIDTMGRYYYSSSDILAAFAISIGLILIGIYTIVTRFKLKNHRSSAPGHLMAVQILSLIMSVGMFAVENVPFADYAVSLIPSVAFIIINAVYYNKRSQLFVY